MIILNETVIMDPDIHQDWLIWIKQIHIPAVMATGFFVTHRILEVLNSPNEGFTYCLQYDAESLEDYTGYQAAHSHLKDTHMKAFENRLVLFESVMQLVN